MLFNIMLIILLILNISLLMLNRYMKVQTDELYNLSIANLELSEVIKDRCRKEKEESDFKYSTACLLLEKYKESE